MRYLRLFWQWVLLLSALVASLLAVCWFVLSSFHEPLIREQAVSRLQAAALLIRTQAAQDLAEGRADTWTTNLRRWSQETGLHFTLLSPHGRVLADSHFSGPEFASQGAQPEILRARSQPQGFGVAETTDSQGQPELALAARVQYQGTLVGFVRTAVSLEPLQRQALTARNWLWGLSLLVAVLAWTIGFRWIRNVTGSLTQVTGALKQMTTGDVAELHLTPRERDEIAVLKMSFNELSQAVSQQVRELRQHANRLTTVLGSMVEGVIAVDVDERVLFANPAAHRLLDFTITQVEGRPIWEVVRHPAIQHVVQQVLRQQPVQTNEFELPRSHRVVAMYVSRIPGNPCPGVVLVLHEVTELRRLERLRQEFVANVSHELKTPLTTIQASTETLLNGALHDSEMNTKFLHTIEEQAERLYQLILDLLQLARIESGRETLEIGAVSVNDVLRRCLAGHQAKAESKRILLDYAAGEPLQVRADEEALLTMINNLIDNAIKYTPEGGKISVSHRRDDGLALIEVTDTGIGIATEHQLRIFERFYRVDKARSRELGGTGLGLSIVKHLAQSLGGSVSVRSKPGQGSTFLIRLPLA